MWYNAEKVCWRKFLLYDFHRWLFLICSCCFTRKKSEVLAKFKEFEALVTNHTGSNIAHLGTDNGGAWAYVGRDFWQYLSGRGIYMYMYFSVYGVRAYLPISKATCEHSQFQMFPRVPDSKSFVHLSKGLCSKVCKATWSSDGVLLLVLLATMSDRRKGCVSHVQRRNELQDFFIKLKWIHHK